MIRAEGVENVWRRHERLATALREGIRTLGLRLFSDSPSYAVTPVWVPEGVEWKRFNKVLKEKYGITIAGGQEEFTGKIFRISHLGYYDELDMVAMLSALEMALAECGCQFTPGSGISAAQASFIKSGATASG
jgi:aspartate aminotransferase-like enzyme